MRGVRRLARSAGAVSVPLPERRARRRRRPRAAARARPRSRPLPGGRRRAEPVRPLPRAAPRLPPRPSGRPLRRAFCDARADASTTQVAAVDGHGFVVTPFARSAGPQRRARALRVGRCLGEGRDGQRLRLAQGAPPLRRAAAARGRGADRARRCVAGGRSWRSRAAATLRSRRPCSLRRPAAPYESSFPSDADPVVLARLEELGARVEVCPRDGAAGRPDLPRAARGARRRRRPLHLSGQPERARGRGRRDARVGDRLVRACRSTGSSCRSAAARSRARASTPSARASRSALLAAMPRIDTVQTMSAWPLRRAFEAMTRGDHAQAVRFASHHRSAFMWPWEEDAAERRARDPRRRDLRLARRRRGDARDRRRRARRRRGRRSSRPTSSPARRPASTSTTRAPPASPACSRCTREGRIAERRADRSPVHRSRANGSAPRRRERDEKLPRTRHPVAQGLRAG